MRIPTYQKQVPYRAAYARDVHLAGPVKEASGKKEWADAASAAGVLSGVYELPQMLNRTLDAYEKGNDGWKAAWGELNKRAREGNRSVYESKQPKPKTAPKKPRGRGYLGMEAGGGFSSPLRGELLDFSREKAFETPAQSAAAPADPVGRLDEYFGQTVQNIYSGGENAAEEDLLSQDYAVLRREVQKLKDKSDQEALKEQFNRGAGSFVQTAALVSTPRALEQYIRANLDAAGADARRSGLDAAQWRAQRETLQAQAVRHNIEAALEAGETPQAEAVYNHFREKLGEEEQALLESKMVLRKADLKSEKLYAQAWKECLDEEGAADEKKLASFVRKTAPADTEDMQNAVRSALQARLAEDRRRDLRRRARGYERLLASCQSGGAGLSALMGEHCRGEKDLKRDARVLRALQADPAKTSDHFAFNRLHERIMSGAGGQKEVESAFEKNEISAADYLRLKSRACAAQAGDADPRERLLGKALDRLCRGCGVEGAEAEEVKYFVFSSGSGVQERLEAAQAARQILNLQEKNK